MRILVVVSFLLFDWGSCILTFLCACKRVRSLSILLRLSYFPVQDPGGPASFYTHASNYAAYLVNPT